jgi:hypothetical protein
MPRSSNHFPRPEHSKEGRLQHCPECGYPCELRQLAIGLDYDWCLICEQEVNSDFFNSLSFDWPGLDDEENDDPFSSFPYSA